MLPSERVECVFLFVGEQSRRLLVNNYLDRVILSILVDEFDNGLMSYHESINDLWSNNTRYNTQYTHVDTSHFLSITLMIVWQDNTGSAYPTDWLIHLKTAAGSFHNPRILHVQRVAIICIKIFRKPVWTWDENTLTYTQTHGHTNIYTWIRTCVCVCDL